MRDHHSYWVAANRPDTVDTSTLTLRPEDEAIPDFLPGQFVTIKMTGAGEMPVPISGDPAVDDGTLQLTVQGPLRDARLGAAADVRGPFGIAWDLDAAAHTDLVLAATDMGLALLRPALLQALRHRGRYRRITLIAGAVTPDHLLYKDELDALACSTGTEVIVTVEQPDVTWHGRVGPVTDYQAKLRIPERTTAMLCGPEPVLRLGTKMLLERGVPVERIQLATPFLYQQRHPAVATR
jgi:NAD(P)H-flavin reductase